MNGNGNGNGDDGTPALKKSLLDGDGDAWLHLCASVSDPNARSALAQIGGALASIRTRDKKRDQSIAEIKERTLAWPDLSFEVDECGRPALTLKKANTTIRQRVGLNDQGIWRSGVSYVKGDVVTHNRSLFICRVDDPKGKPEDASGCWRLAVMRGRDAPAPKASEP